MFLKFLLNTKLSPESDGAAEACGKEEEGDCTAEKKGREDGEREESVQSPSLKVFCLVTDFRWLLRLTTPPLKSSW